MDITSTVFFRLYRVLLTLYPSEFRTEWEGEIMRTVRVREKALGSKAGVVKQLSFWGREVLAVLRTAASQRWAWASVGDPSGVSLRSGTRRNHSNSAGGSPRRPSSVLDQVSRDLRFALRQLLRNPGLTLAAVLTLALGIGANTAVFSVVSGVLLEPLPYPRADRLVRVYDIHPMLPNFPLAPAAFNDYREIELPFSAFATFSVGNLQLSEGERPEQLTGMRVSAEFFRVLEMEPALGRGFTREEELAGNHYKVVLGHQLWQRRFGGDARVLGRTLELSGRTFTVVGVAHPDLQSPGGDFRSVLHGEAVDLWWPLVLGPDEQPRRSHYLNGIARLRDGVTHEQAEAIMNVIAAEVIAPFVDPEAEAEPWSMKLVPLADDIVGHARGSLLVLLGAAGLILLMACVNMAGVMLARASDRQGEIALRLAIGASRGHLIRQMLVEGAIVASLGGVTGILLGFVGLGWLLGLAPEGLPRLYAIGLDVRVLAFATAATALSALAGGLVPAFHTHHFDVADTLKASGVRAIRSAVRSRRVLVVSQVALAVVLLVGAGLLLHSFVKLQNVDPGFRPHGVLTARLSLPSARYQSADKMIDFYRELETQMGALPGVQAAGISYALPWSGYDENSSFTIEGWEAPEDLWLSLRYHFVTSDFFSAIGIPLLEGRALRESDDRSEGTPPVALINEAMAQQYWRVQPDVGEPVGSQINFWGQLVTVVGIVGDIKDGPTNAAARPAAFFPILQWPRRAASVALQTQGDPNNLVGPLREVVSSLDPALAVADITPLSDIAGATTASARFTFVLVGMFAAVALALAVVGLYGLLAYLVGQRRQEIAVRMALGAASERVLRLVVREGVTLAALGLVFGIASSLAFARLLTSLLFGVTPFDLVTLLGVALGVIVAAGAACLIPAFRAARVEPARAMK